MKSLDLDPRICITCYDSEHFFLPKDEFSNYIKAGKHNRMENFYRKMRKRFNVLMVADQPLGERWNFDGDNRKKLKPADLAVVPEPLLFSNDVGEILRRIEKHQIKSVGEATDNLPWPINHLPGHATAAFFLSTLPTEFRSFPRRDDSAWRKSLEPLSFAAILCAKQQATASHASH